MNKNGFIGDLGFILVALFLFALFVIIGYNMFTGVNDKIQANTDISAQGKELVQDNKDRYVGLFDGIFMFVLAAMFILLFISVISIDTRPEFFFIVVIILAALIAGSAMLSNVYENVSTNAQLNNTSSEFSFMPFVFERLPMITLAAGFIIVLGLFGKVRGWI